jgi:hypothetical protein
MRIMSDRTLFSGLANKNYSAAVARRFNSSREVLGSLRYRVYSISYAAIACESNMAALPLSEPTTRLLSGVWIEAMFARD